ncbi:DUF3426 domain-containing protein [Candidatus Halobeggiatoa sp. HSG11]|nr:DUF3426 domain-containing protein [Candidatus Halobeggiatoa sp. HSG11]
MHAQCPHCQTIFRVTAAHLNIAQGHVRCSHCRTIFNATNYLLSQLPKQATTTSKQSDDFQEDEVPELLEEEIYEEGRSWSSLFFWALMVILFGAILAGQYIWYWQPDKVLQHKEARPWLEKICYNFLCDLPPTYDTASFSMQDHIAQVHLEVDNAIQFEATFINTANFPQPYPHLQLTFEDYNGKPLAQRNFKPSEYLQHSLMKGQQMRPQASVHIKLELSDMDDFIEDNIVVSGYHFEFF